MLSISEVLTVDNVIPIPRTNTKDEQEHVLVDFSARTDCLGQIYLVMRLTPAQAAGLKVGDKVSLSGTLATPAPA